MPRQTLPKDIAAKVEKLPDGIVVGDLHASKGARIGARWYFRVRDPIARSATGKTAYIRKAWADYDAGEAWAKTEHAKVHLGLATSEAAKLSELGPAYVKGLVGRSRTTRYQNTVSQVWKSAVAAGIDDLKDPLVHTRVERWLGGLTAARRGQKKAKPASARTRNQFRVVLNAIIAHAMATPTRPLAHNPIASVKPWPVTTRSRAVFTVDELRKLVSEESRWRLQRDYDATMRALEAADGDRREAARALKCHLATVYNRLNAGPQGEDPWWLYSMLGVYTGCRPTEVRHLAWGMIDWHNGDVVLPADHPGNKTKTERRFELFDELLDVLRERYRVGATGPILPAAIADVREDTATKAFQAYARRCGVDSKGRGPHTLRHNCGALMTAMRLEDVAILIRMGHENVKVSKEYRRSAPMFRNDVDGWGRQMRLRGAASRSATAAASGTVGR